jgi:hypothetical protein
MDRSGHWLDWHRAYADPSSSLSRRRRVVQDYLRQSLADLLPAGEAVRLLSMCAGDGGDVLEVLASAPAVLALLVELDPELAGRARGAALPNVRVLTADAGRTANYADWLPVDVLLACGVFGNISAADVRRTVGALPAMVRPGGWVIWTRGRGDGESDASQPIRQLFADAGFVELDFTAPDDAQFRVGLHRLDRPPAALTELPAELFRFSED